MKLRLMNYEGQQSIIECKSFQFDNGYLKMLLPENNNDKITEMYLAISKIVSIENYGEPKVDVIKDSK